MPRWKKTSSAKIAEVVTKKLIKPDKSVREIAKETKVSKSTVWEILVKEAPKLWTSSDYTQKLVDTNIKILQKWKEIILKELQRINKKNWVKITSVKDIKNLSSTMQEAFKQNQLLTWNNTENTEIKIKIIE